MPAEAGIQYTPAPEISSCARGVLDRPVKPDDDRGICRGCLPM